MKSLHDALDDFVVESVFACPVETIFQDFCISLFLKNGQVVLAFIGSDLFANLHALQDEHEEGVIRLVQLSAKVGESFIGFVLTRKGRE